MPNHIGVGSQYWWGINSKYYLISNLHLIPLKVIRIIKADVDLSEKIHGTILGLLLTNGITLIYLKSIPHQL